MAGEVRLLDLSQNVPPQILPDRAASVLSLALSPGGRTLAVANGDGIVELWEIDRRD